LIQKNKKFKILKKVYKEQYKELNNEKRGKNCLKKLVGIQIKKRKG
jgi:hypothetical protein